MPLLATFIVPHPPIILPEIGRGEQQKIQKTIQGYQIIAHKIAELKPDTIIITTPHSTMYSNYFHISPGPTAQGSLSQFGASSIKITVDYDSELREKIISKARDHELPVGVMGEKNKTLDHGTMVPLVFINQFYNNYQIIRIGLSGMSPLHHYELGMSIKEAIDEVNRKVVIVSSGDLSHKLTKEGPYGFSHEGPLFDQQLVLAIINIDFLAMMNFSSDFCDAAAECGLNSFIIMAGALHGMAVESELHSYEGPFGVGYATATFKPTKPDELRRFDQIYRMNQTELLSKIKAEEDSYVRLARQSLEFFIRSKKHLKRPDGLQDELINQKAGVFVSLKIEGRLRGCIGTIEPTSACIADEIIQNAVSSGTADPRFSPVSEIELDQIVYSVDVLKKSETVSTIDELDAKRYGVIVRYRGKSGLLLPNLEGVDTPQEQLEIALQKAGIDPSLPYSIERFEVIRHH